MTDKNAEKDSSQNEEVPVNECEKDANSGMKDFVANHYLKKISDLEDKLSSTKRKVEQFDSEKIELENANRDLHKEVDKLHCKITRLEEHALNVKLHCSKNKRKIKILMSRSLNFRQIRRKRRLMMGRHF